MNTEDLKPAPRPLWLVQQFLNTRSLLRGFDLLGTPADFGAWCEEVVGVEWTWSPTGQDLERYKELREAFRDVVLSHTLGTSATKAEAAEAINRLLSANVLQTGFSSDAKPTVTTQREGSRGLEGMLMEAALDAHYAQTWHRLKVCANEECRWSFYDSSKNRSATWCDMAICGSRAKMRAYRERHSS